MLKSSCSALVLRFLSVGDHQGLALLRGIVIVYASLERGKEKSQSGDSSSTKRTALLINNQSRVQLLWHVFRHHPIKCLCGGVLKFGSGETKERRTSSCPFSFRLVRAAPSTNIEY